MQHNFALAALYALDGSTALVTGARSGIGRATALTLADCGADVVLWGRTPDGLDEVADEVRARGRRADLVFADLVDPVATRETAEALVAEREIDLLVNDAGTIFREDAKDLAFADWQRVIDLNLNAAFLLCQIFGSAMVARGAGRIVNVASLLSFQGGIRVPAYAASKHGLVGLTKALANEWAASGVGVNAVAPGYVVTDNTAALRADADRERAITERIPAGRWASAEEIAGTIAFLCSPAACYIHGHVLSVDGGWMGR